MSCAGTSDCLCGCCAGTSVQTPQQPFNLPGLPAISRRIGTWATFKESFLARLSSSDYPALGQLKSRADDDFTPAILDACSVMLHILSFYQERLNNEFYLRTAGQPRSLTELSRLIGYQPAPGVAASTYLAYTLKGAPGLRTDPTAPAITIPAGSQVQSVPAQGQIPQTFETSADILAKPDWSALPVQTVQPWVPATGDTQLYLAGVATQLNPGDAILIVGQERALDPNSTYWDVRIIIKVIVDATNKRTCITWNEGLGGQNGAPAQSLPQIYALRQRAALFGYNAINPNLLDTTSNNSTVSLLTPSTTGQKGPYTWQNYSIANTIDLDSVYPKVVQNGWVVLVAPKAASSDAGRSLPGTVALIQIGSLFTTSRTDFGLSSKITRITPAAGTATNWEAFQLNNTFALVQSEALPAADLPLTFPLYGTVLDLADVRADLITPPVQVVAVSGTRQKLAVAEGETTVSFSPDGDPGSLYTLRPGEVVTLLDPTQLPTSYPTPDPTTQLIPPWAAPASLTNIAQLSVEDARGRTGSLQNVNLGQFVLAPSGASDPQVSEYAFVSSAVPAGFPYAHTQLQLTHPLTYCYDRATTTVNANVVPATQGRTVSEIMGSGSASIPNQSFVLKQSPLTYVQAANASGGQSTLQVQVNAVTWAAAPTLYEAGASSQVYTTLNQSDGTTDVLFGDGSEGALLPTGQNNLQATYRVGLGAAGNVAGGTLTTLMDRPLGVSGVTNPAPAAGGQDPQSADDIRASAPQTVLTLGRAVSILDYQNFATTYAGISKAYAVWIPSGPGRGVFLTVAGVGGTVLAGGANSTLVNLFAALQSAGNPEIPITITSYVETLFQFSADVLYDGTYDQGAVQTQLMQALTTAFGFAARTFGQGVSSDEVAAVMQGVAGVVAVNITGLTRTTSSTGGDISGQGGLSLAQWNTWLSNCLNLPRLTPDTASQLFAGVPVANALSPPLPAEILVLDPSVTPASWGVMS